RTAAELAAERSAATVVVSNEVGLGVVPSSELGRLYRDVLGRANALWAAAADEAAFVIAGRMLPLRGRAHSRGSSGGSKPPIRKRRPQRNERWMRRRSRVAASVHS